MTSRRTVRWFSLWLLWATLAFACGRGETDAAPNIVQPAPAAAVQRDPRAIYRRSFAVVVGIDDYVNLDRLSGAVRDAHAMTRALQDEGFEVTELINEQATIGRLREVLGDQLRQQLAAEDRALVYFAGHGVSVGESGGEIGYLMPVEGKSYSPVATGISMSELALWFQAYASKHVMFLADACYAGLALATRGVALTPGSSGYLDQISSRRVRYSLVAGGADEEAHEWNNQGVFTHFVLRGMQGEADSNRDGLVTSDELSGYVRPQVSNLVSQQFRASQLPQSARSGTGEFVFFVDQAPTQLTPQPAMVALPARAIGQPPAALPAEQAAPVVAPVPAAPAVAATGFPASHPPTHAKLNVIGIWSGPSGWSLRVQREGVKTIMIGTEPEGRFVLGMIEKTAGQAEFEGAARKLSGPSTGQFAQLRVQLTALDATSAQLQTLSQPIDGVGANTGPAMLGEPMVFHLRPAPPADGERLDIIGEWEGGEDRKVTIQQDGDQLVLSCTDRWGSFSGRTRHWTSEEAVFEGKGAPSFGRRKDVPYRIAARFTRKTDDVLMFEPVLQFLGINGEPPSGPLLGYSWAVKRVAMKTAAAP